MRAKLAKPAKMAAIDLRPVKILFAEDSADDVKLVLRALRAGGFAPAHTRVQTAADFTAALAGERWDAVISDYSMPGFTGLDALRIFRATGIDIPFILVSGTIGEEFAADAMKAGASDYVMKLNLARLAPALERELKDAQVRATHSRSQRDLVESERRLRTLIETGPECVKVVNREGALVEMNPAGLAMLEAGSLAAVQSRTLIEFVVPEHRAAFIALHQRVVGGESGILQFQVVGLEGGRRWLETHAAPLRGANAGDTMLLGITRDITERKKTEQALRQSEERTRMIVESSLDAVVAMDASGRITDWNTQAEKTFGWSRDQAIGALLAETIVPMGRREAHRRGVRAFLETGAGPILGKRIEISAMHRDGREFPVELTISPIKLDGAWIFSSFIRDLSERKRGEEALRRFSAAMDATSDAIYLVDRASMGFVHVNEAACRMQSLTREELLALGPEGVLGASRAELERRYDAMIASGVPAEPLELLRTRKDGSQVWVELRRHAQPSGEGWTIVTMVRDITEQKGRDENLRRFRAAMDVSGDAILLVDRESMLYIDVNQTLCDLVGRTREELIGTTPMEIFNADRETLERDYDAIIADNNSPASKATGEYRHKNGSVIPIETRRRALNTGNGWVIVGTARDITERKAAEDRIVYLNRVFAVLSGINTLIVRVHDRDELFREACRVAVEIGGFRLAWIGMADRASMKLVPVASAGDNVGLVPALGSDFVLEEDATVRSTLAVRAIGEKIPMISNDSQSDPKVALGGKHVEAGIRSMAMLPLIVSGEAVGVLGLYAGEIEFFHAEEMKLLTELAGDISFAIDHIAKRERLEYLAFYDVLTGLANRSLFLERVAQHMRSAAGGGHKLAVFFVDIERFKNINDSLGRQAGDALLKQVGEWLTAGGSHASLIARVGADHFAVVMPKVRIDGDVARFIENRVESFREHQFSLNDASFRIAIKIGVAIFPDDGDDADTLLRNAEAALKKAKERGERYLFYKQKMTEKVAGKLTLENKLRRALDNEEYVLHYQPKVNLLTGRMTSAEALIRWKDPATGLVPPGHFIPILEETGLIHDVGRWALRKAIADYLRWKAAGLPAVRIAVNVSPLQLRDSGFIAEVEKATGVDPQAPGGLELEITESLIMEDVKHSIASLQAIRALGITIAIDDFGTGFSSLSYLAKLPVDTLKIDRSFVIDMTSGPNGLLLVSTVIKLAHSLKLKVVAEGVETQEQSRLLRLLGCNEMQGYLFSRPVPAAEFEAKFLVALPAGAPAMKR